METHDVVFFLAMKALFLRRRCPAIGPRELCHAFVSVRCGSDVPIEAITDVAGHETTIVTQKICRHPA